MMLPRHAAMRSSGARLLGDVPSHWRIAKLRSVARPRNERNRADLPLLSVARERGVFVRAGSGEDNHNVIPDDLSNYKVACQGDLVINKMKAWQGSMGVAPCDGIVSPAYFVFRLDVEHVRFGQALLRSRPYVGMFAAASDGVRVGQWDLSIAGMKEIPVLLPPGDEQVAIVRFLDHIGGRIERAIRAKRKVIALLQEQKEAIIERAVTQGVGPHSALQPSATPWLSQVPAHWRMQPLKQLLARIDYGTSESGKREGRVRMLTMGHIRDGKVWLPTSGCLPSVPPGLVLDRDDLLFNRTNSPELVGKVGLFCGEASDEVTFASYLVRLRVRAEHSPAWLCLLLNSCGFWAYARSQALVSLHQANLNPTRYVQMLLPVPASRYEEEAIVDDVRSRTRHIERRMTELDRETQLLVEFRTRLTADIVTGKLDVREVASKLPDEPAELDEPDLELADDPSHEETVVE